MFERRLHALVAGLVLLGTAIVMTVVVARDRTGSALQALDDRWLAWMTEIRTAVADPHRADSQRASVARW